MTDGLENVFLNKLTRAIEEEGRHAIGKRNKKVGGGFEEETRKRGRKKRGKTERDPVRTVRLH